MAIALWWWLKKNPDKGKNDWPGWWRGPYTRYADVVRHQLGKASYYHVGVLHHCPLCEYTARATGALIEQDCTLCPCRQWAEEARETYAPCEKLETSPYWQWRQAHERGDWGEAALAAYAMVAMFEADLASITGKT